MTNEHYKLKDIYMKVAIIQMSDLHITSEKDYIIDKAKKTSSSVSDIKCLQTHSL